MTLKQIQSGLKEKGISQREFAVKLGVSEVQLSKWINGHRNPSKTALTAIKLVYNLNYESWKP